jgi:hypothetical protein
VVGVVGDGHVGRGEHEFLRASAIVEAWAELVLLRSTAVLTPLLGFTPPRSTASMMLPFSSATSRTQSVLPVATTKCVLHALTCP